MLAEAAQARRQAICQGSWKDDRMGLAWWSRAPSRAMVSWHAWARCNPSIALHYLRGGGGRAAWDMCQAARIMRESCVVGAPLCAAEAWRGGVRGGVKLVCVHGRCWAAAFGVAGLRAQMWPAGLAGRVRAKCGQGDGRGRTFSINPITVASRSVANRITAIGSNLTAT